MDIQEIYRLQKQCRKRAKKITKRLCRRYDAIWTERIRVTPELMKLAGKRLNSINRKMPNLFLKNVSAPDAAEIAARYGFSDTASLLDYLASYQPRKLMEERIYQILCEKAFVHLPLPEQRVAIETRDSDLYGIIRQSRRFAKEMTMQAYEKYDEVWSGGIRITPELLKHGKDVIAEINHRMPNLFTRNPFASALDQKAMEHKFESSQDLIDWLLEYTPRRSMLESLTEELARESLGLPLSETEITLDEVPF